MVPGEPFAKTKKINKKEWREKCRRTRRREANVMTVMLRTTTSESCSLAGPIRREDDERRTPKVTHGDPELWEAMQTQEYNTILGQAGARTLTLDKAFLSWMAAMLSLASLLRVCQGFCATTWKTLTITRLISLTLGNGYGCCKSRKV